MITVIESILYAVFLFRYSDHLTVLSTILIGPDGHESLFRGSLSFLFFVGIFIYLYAWKLKGDEVGMAFSVFTSGFAAYIVTDYVGCHFHLAMSALLFVLVSFGFTYMHFYRCTERDRGRFSWHVRPSNVYGAVIAALLYGLYAVILACAIVRTYYINEATAYAYMESHYVTGMLIILLTMSAYLLVREAIRQAGLNKEATKKNGNDRGGDYKSAEALNKKIDELMARLIFLARRDLLDAEDARRFVSTYDRYTSMIRHSNLEKISISYLESVYSQVSVWYEKYKSLYLAEYEKEQIKKKREETLEEERIKRAKEFEEAKRKAYRAKGEYRSGPKKEQSEYRSGPKKEQSEYRSGSQKEKKKAGGDERDFYRNSNFNSSNGKQESKYKKEKPKWSTTYFKNCRSEDDLRKQYLRLVKIYHPDNKKTGDSDIFKTINSEYRFLMRQFSPS